MSVRLKRTGARCIGSAQHETCEPGRHCDDVSAQKHRSWMILQESLVLFRESSFLRKISPIFVRERVLMYCDFQYMSQLANLGLYVPKGYIQVPSYHKYWRTHIFIFQNLMPSSFVRSSISSFIISKPKDVGSTPQTNSHQLAFNMPWWVHLWVL